MNLQENIQRIREMMGLLTEGLHDTYWQNEEGDKITLIDLLDATQNIPVEEFSVEELKPHLLTWDGNEDEVKKIESADLQYPILIFVNDDGEFISIIDGHHRAQKAVRKGLKTIKAKVIPINYLPENIKKVFKHLNKNNSRLTFDMQKLLDDNIIFITQGHDLTTGKRIKPEIDPQTGELFDDSTNLITLHNIINPEVGSQKGIPIALKHLRPDMIDYWQQTQGELVDDKYNQIIKSIELKGKEVNDYII